MDIKVMPPMYEKGNCQKYDALMLSCMMLSLKVDIFQKPLLSLHLSSFSFVIVLLLLNSICS